MAFYTREFRFKNVPFFKRKRMQKEFLALRELAVEELNGNYDSWNDEFMHIPDKNDWWDYMDFIYKKQKIVLDRINAKYPESYCVLDSDPEESCDIIGRTRKGAGRIDMLFKPYRRAL